MGPTFKGREGSTGEKGKGWGEGRKGKRSEGREYTRERKGREREGQERGLPSVSPIPNLPLCHCPPVVYTHQSQ